MSTAHSLFWLWVRINLIDPSPVTRLPAFLNAKDLLVCQTCSCPAVVWGMAAPWGELPCSFRQCEEELSIKGVCTQALNHHSERKQQGQPSRPKKWPVLLSVEGNPMLFISVLCTDQFYWFHTYTVYILDNWTVNTRIWLSYLFYFVYSILIVQN